MRQERTRVENSTIIKATNNNIQLSDLFLSLRSIKVRAHTFFPCLFLIGMFTTLFLSRLISVTCSGVLIDRLAEKGSKFAYIPPELSNLLQSL